jgi:hypothetical protein
MADFTPKLTAPVTILGRTMTVKRPTDAQVALMHRHGVITDRTLRKAATIQDEAFEAPDEAEKARLEEAMSPHFAQGMASMAEILDMIMYLFPDEDDQQWLVDQMKRGNLTAVETFAAFDPFMKKGNKSAGPAKRIR